MAMNMPSTNLTPSQLLAIANGTWGRSLDTRAELAQRGLRNANTARDRLLQKQNWSLDCIGLLSKVGVTVEQLKAGASDAQFKDGFLASQTRAWLYRLSPAGPAAAATAEYSLSIQLWMESDATQTAAAELLGSTIFIRPDHWANTAVGELVATVAHEVLHNLTGLVDTSIQDAFGLSTTAASHNISVRLREACF